MNINFDIKNVQFDYNSKVIITYLLICIFTWILNLITRGKSNKLFFESYRSSPLNPLTYIRLFTHSIGHRDWDHLVNNFLIILLIGPMIEEKYGSINLIIMFLITSFVIAIFNILFSFLMIINGFRSTIVIAQYKDILVVGFHEITLTGDLLHRLRIGLQLPDLRLIALEFSVVPLRLLRQFVDTLEILDVTPDTVLVKEADNQYTSDTHHRIFQELRPPDT